MLTAPIRQAIALATGVSVKLPKSDPKVATKTISVCPKMVSPKTRHGWSSYPAGLMHPPRLFQPHWSIPPRKKVSLVGSGGGYRFGTERAR
jgi:hypothetical protein